MLHRLALLGLFIALALNSNAQAQVVNAKKRIVAPTIDGITNESEWQFNNTITKNIIGTSNNSTKFAVLWDSLYLYVAFQVTDASKYNESTNAWDDDAVEIYLDAENDGGTTFGINDRQFVKEWNSTTIWERSGKTTNVTHGWANTATGYTVEIRIAWSNIGITNPAIGRIIGFDPGSDDDDNGGARESQVLWNGDNDNWQYPRNFGDLVLVGGDTQAPTAPTNLATSNLTQSSLTLTWTAATDNVGVTGYDVYRNGTKINAATLTTTSYSVTGLSAATAYQFYTRGLDASGNVSANSNTVSITTPDTQAPTAVGNVSISNLASTSLTLNWTAATDNVGIAGYDVYRNGVKIVSLANTVLTYSITALTPSTAYTFYIASRDAANNTTNTSTVQATTKAPLDTQAPTAPSNLNYTNLLQNSVVLNWTAATDNVAVTGYDIYKDGVKINTSNITTTTYSVTGLNAAQSYIFYITAKDAANNSSAASNTINVLTPDTQAPSVPTLTLSAISQTSITINWPASTDNVGVTGYKLYQDGLNIATLTSTATSYTDSNLNNNTSYAFYLEATDAAGNKSQSTTVTGTTLAPPDTELPTNPADLVASSVLQNSVSLSWTASTDNIGVTAYDIYLNGVKTFTLASNSFIVSGLTASTNYSIYIIAKDAAGNQSGPSNTVSITTPDTQAPTAPLSVAATIITEGTLTLSWQAATDNVAVTGYDVYRNNTKINTSVVTGTTYAVTGLTAATAYTFFVQARDAAGNISASSNTASITTSAPAGCAGTGSIRYQTWSNLTGSAVTDLTSTPTYPNSPTTSGTLTSFEIPTNAADNYGMKVFGYICPPTTGSYTFWIASDDNSELWLSTNASAASKVRIAYHTQYTNSREWNKYPTQKSVAITLTAGQLYYVEALMKEGSQGDNMAVGWSRPGQATTAPSEVIPGTQLVPSIPDTQVPSTPTNLAATAITQTSLSLSWTASTDNIGVAGYEIYRNGTKLNTTLATSSPYAVTGLTASANYSFTVIAKDAAGNASATSNVLSATTLVPNPGSEKFTQRTVIANLRQPHDLVYGPDNNIWYTERFGGTVSYVNPATGAKTVVLTLGSKMVLVGGQDGLMGLALHPAFLTGKPYVYISYTYQSTSATVRKTRIERYTYDASTRKLISPVTILENIPGSNDHNSARLAIGPDLLLYYSVGDMGAGQFENQTRTENAQNLNINEGKILRLNTEIVGSSWIPADNPFSNAGVKTPVFTYGHRNPQGLVWGNVNGINRLYSSEHGPYSDDEVNIIEVGRNYGWPRVAGFCDGNYNGRVLGGVDVGSEQSNCAALNVKEPIRSLFPAANPPVEGTNNLTWPSTAVSGTEFYSSNAIPGWQNSLLIAQLKNSSLLRLKLSNDGLSIISDTINYFRGKGRMRDVVVSSDGLKIYIACDSSGSTSGPTGNVSGTPPNPGSILEFTYQPSTARSITEPVAQAQQVMIEEVNNKNIEVYPNPATEYAIAYNYKALPGLKLELHDINGRLIMSQKMVGTATRINTMRLGNGVYILQVRDGRGKLMKREKLIVQK